MLKVSKKLPAYLPTGRELDYCYPAENPQVCDWGRLAVAVRMPSWLYRIEEINVGNPCHGQYLPLVGLEQAVNGLEA